MLTTLLLHLGREANTDSGFLAADDLLNSTDSSISILPEISIGDLGVMSDLDSDEDEHQTIKHT